MNLFQYVTLIQYVLEHTMWLTLYALTLNVYVMFYTRKM